MKGGGKDDNSTIVEIYDALLVSRATESGAIEQV